MTLQGFLSLAIQTVTAPREVARLLLSLRLRGDAILTAFALVVTLNALIFQISLLIAPVPAAAGVLATPVVFAGLQALVLMATILALTWTGQAMGGQGTLQEVALLLIWLQAMRVLVQASLLLILPLSDLLAGLVMIAASALGVWILVHFIDEVHGYGRMSKSALILLLAVTGMAVGLSLILSLLGVTEMGINGNV